MNCAYKEEASISYKELYLDVEVGSIILIDDGLIKLKVKEIKDKNMICTVINGGPVSSNKLMHYSTFSFNL